jgi:hypothetical protein
MDEENLFFPLVSAFNMGWLNLGPAGEILGQLIRTDQKVNIVLPMFAGPALYL